MIFFVTSEKNPIFAVEKNFDYEHCNMEKTATSRSDSCFGSL